jgi:hypothetical protein
MRKAGAFAIVLLLAAPALAGDHDSVLAETLFREGRQAVDAGDLKGACDKFAHSYRLDPAPGTLLNLGDCEERLGKLASAWVHFIQLHDVLAPADDRRALAQSRADAVSVRLPRVRVVLAKSTPEGARVLRDGAPLDSAAIGMLVPVDPGSHVLVVHVDGRRDRETKITVAEAEKRDVTLEAGALLPPPVVALPPPEHHGLGGRRVVAVVVAGAGVLALGAGFVTGGVALGTQSQSNKTCNSGVCSDQTGVDLHEQAKTQALVADVLLGVGVVALAAGAVLWFTGKPATAAVGLAPNGIVLRGVF